MSRLDQHILVVRNKLTLGIFVKAWARAGLLFSVLILLTIVAQRLLDRTLGHPGTLFWIGVAVTAIGAAVYALMRRPSSERAAIEIDQALGLKEKFSTALYVRPVSDPFAQAAVRDAEAAAQNVSVYRRFPIEMPRQIFTIAGVLMVVLLVWLFMPTLHLVPKAPPARPRLEEASAKSRHDDFVKAKLPTIIAPAAMPDTSDAIKTAADNLNKAVHTEDGDQLHKSRSVLSALQNYHDAMAKELEKNSDFQTVMNDKDRLSAISSAKDDSTPIGKAQNELRSGNLDSAVKDIAKAVSDFDKAKPEDQQKMIDQAKNLANELAKAGNDPKVQQKIAQQLMQMGASQAQAQQMANTMRQAAQGNPKAQQQMTKLAQQMTQQMNGGQGPTQQQQQMIQKMMTQAQAMANSQAQAQSLSSAAKQLATTMAQAKSGSAQSGQQNQNAHSAQGQGKGQSGQPGQQQMAQAGQNLQQQLQQMQAQAQSAQAMQNSANAAAQAAADAAAGINDGTGNGQDQANPQPGQGQGNAPGQGLGGNNAQWNNKPGKGGAKMGIAAAPYTFKQEVDPSRENKGGVILASRYVKAGIDPGKSTAGLRDAAASAEKDAADDIEQDHIPREEQQAEKDYFSAMQKADQQ